MAYSRNKIIKYIINVSAFLFFSAFVIKFAGPGILKQYITYGIGNCKDIPVLCRQPEDNIFKPEIDKEYLNSLIPQNFPKMSISVPKGFTLIQELIKKRYYKKRHANHKAVIYLLYQEPKAFIKLYPEVEKQGITDNEKFIHRLMHANLNQLNNITDAFFVIMKSIFTPDIGNQNTAKMVKFELNNIKGFINYTMAKPAFVDEGKAEPIRDQLTDNYFDCNILDDKGSFFKVYIRDAGARLDLNNVFAIISTLKPIE